MSKCLLIILLFSAVFAFDGFSQSTKYSLIVTQYQLINPKALMQDIYRYNFENGEFKGKEKLLTVTGKDGAKDLIRADVEGSFVFKNRWLVTGIGNIIDLQTKQVVFSDKATFIKESNDSLIFYTNDVFKGKFYSVFNAKTGKLTEVKSIMFSAILAQDIEIDYSTSNRAIWLYPPNKDKILLVIDAGFGEEIINSKKTSQIPVYWLDKNNFIFPYYNVSKNEATIFKVNTDKTQTKIGVIKDIPKSHINSFFAKDGDGNLEYVCGKGKYYLEVKNAKISEVIFEHEGSGYDVESKIQPYGHAIKYNKADIGKYQCDIKNIRTCKFAIAVDNKIKIGAEVYPQGIAVWNNITKKWKSIDAEEVAAIAGWIVE